MYLKLICVCSALPGTAGKDDKIARSINFRTEFWETILPVPFHVVPIAFGGVEGAAAEKDELFPCLRAVLHSGDSSVVILGIVEEDVP